MPPALMERIERQLGVVVQTSWGMTELSPTGAFGVMSDEERFAALSGRPALGVDLMVADETGAPLAQQRDQEGRLFVRGAAVIERYFGQNEPVVDADGWFDTGDLARISRRGDLMITGRSKDLIKSGGEWINPAEIEAIISALPEVALAAVIGRADVKWSERPVLLVELRDGQDMADEALLGALKGRIASWWMPDAVIRLEAMPLASTGKIDKMRLRALYSNG
ncbi:Long-chain-fatty-acid--CoA ligase [compost metagenome]